MRILLADTTIGGSLIGGAQTFLVKLLRGLIDDGHDVHLLADGEGEGWVRDALRETGAKIHSNLLGGDLVDDATPRIAEWINELSPDVYVISVSPDIGWSVLPHLDPRIATLTIGHNDVGAFYDPVKHYARFLTRAIGVSDTICRKYVEIFERVNHPGLEDSATPPSKGGEFAGSNDHSANHPGLEDSATPPSKGGQFPDQVVWIPYGVETLENFEADVSRAADRSEEPGPIRLAYVGRFENTQKRIADVVAIARQLSSEGVAFKFDLVGDGEEMPFVREQLSDLIAEGSVRIHGWLPSEKVIEKLRESEVFVLASAYEGFCISLIEAIANGCAPVVTDIESGNKQLVEDGVNGFVVPVGDIDAFIGKIGVLAGDRDRLLQMRSRAWDTGKQYSVERMVANYVDCFERAVADARANPRVVDPEFPLMESCRSKYPLWLRRLKARVSPRSGV